MRQKKMIRQWAGGLILSWSALFMVGGLLAFHRSMTFLSDGWEPGLGFFGLWMVASSTPVFFVGQDLMVQKHRPAPWIWAGFLHALPLALLLLAFSRLILGGSQ